MRQPIPSRPAVPASSRVVGGAGKNGANGKGPHRKKKRANQAIVVPRSVVPDHVYEGMPKVDKKIKRAVHAMFKQYAKDSKWKKDYATIDF